MTPFLGVWGPSPRARCADSLVKWPDQKASTKLCQALAKRARRSPRVLYLLPYLDPWRMRASSRRSAFDEKDPSSSRAPLETKPGSFLHLLSVVHRLAQCGFVHVGHIPASRNTPSKLGNVDIKWLDRFFEVEGRGLAFNVRVHG